MLGLNLTRGCVHRCVFCSVRPVFRSNDAILEVDPNLPGQLESELRVKRPRAVYISPATDPFPPLGELQQMTADVVALLAEYRVSSWLMTRGLIRAPALEVLKRHREFVKVTIAMTTSDRALQRQLEPGTAPPRLRLRQIERLRDHGIPVQVALEPLIPAVTDTTENLQPLLRELAGAGVEHVTTGYIFLREAITEQIKEELPESDVAELILEEFRGGPLLTSPGMSPARYLPKARRQRGYARVMSLAASVGIQVGLSAVTNPDFVRQRPVEVAVSTPRPSLRTLFAQHVG